MKTVLYGICGIGNGHFYRQLPIITKLLDIKQLRIIFFAYQNSLSLLKKHFSANPNVHIFEVNVPYYKGDTVGLNFQETKQLNRNFNFDINFEAFSLVQKTTPTVDLVISDYEPFSAQLGYAYNAPVVTIDQQSKFFTRNTPESINGFTCTDEIMRLGMFFPKATRLACSFFNVEPANDVQVYPPILRNELKEFNLFSINNKIVVYLSAQDGFFQEKEDFIAILRKFENTTFDVYLKDAIRAEVCNINIYPHGCASFDTNLTTCSAVIATAGHSLLSECMFLKKPVYAMPMQLYEQQLNAKIIGDNNLGVNRNALFAPDLEYFIKSLEEYRYNIETTNSLNRGDGLHGILKSVQSLLHKDDKCLKI